MENTKAKGNLFMTNEKSKAKLVAQGPIDMEEGKIVIAKEIANAM
mgnify:CR=1 FL=1